MPTSAKITALTQQVLKEYSRISDQRTRDITENLIKHLHGFITETHIVEKEWEIGWQFLVDMAKITTDDRNEFVLLSDVLGITTLVDLITHQNRVDIVDSALLGPFYRANAPLRGTGNSIASADTPGIPVIIRGFVTTEKNAPIANALLDVWQAANNGMYETEDENQPDMNLRGQFKTDAKGYYEFKAIMPTGYPIPTDGPVGQLLTIAKRHPYRPAHIHFIVSAPGYETLVTQIFSEEDEKAQNDVVFGVKDSLVANFKKHDSKELAQKQGVTNPFYTLDYNFQLLAGVSTFPKAPIS